MVGSRGPAESDERQPQGAGAEIEARYRSLFDYAPDGILIADPNSVYLDANPSMCRMLGYAREELIGLHASHIVAPAEVEHIEAALETIHANAEHARLWLFRRKDGSTFPAEVIARMMPDGNLVGMVRDVTERKAAERALREREAQLRTLRDEMHQAQKMEAVGRLAGGVAHDFNNMLSVILGYVDLAQQRLPEGAAGRSELLEIQRAAERSAELTRDLLAFSRKQLVHPRAIDVAQVIASMENMLRRLLGEDVELLLQLERTSGAVFADPKQLEQVVMNLSVNARDAMLNGGKLHIEVGSVELDSALADHEVELEPGRYVTLAVTDNGSGMDAATRARIFEPFFTTKEQGKGTGLGLSTVFGIVKQSRGHITVYSEPGCGSTFKVYLPRIDSTPEPLAPPSLPPEKLGGSETILLVEDEEQVRRVSAEILEGCGYRLLVARDAFEACAIADHHPEPIDLLLTDVVMARMSGRELANKLAPLRPEMRVLYVSGYTQGAIEHQGVLEPGIAFLQKPVTRRMLCEKVREVLDARPTSLDRASSGALRQRAFSHE